MLPAYLDATEVADILRLTTQTIQKLCKRGDIPNLVIGRRYRVPSWWVYEKAGMLPPKEVVPHDQQLWLF